MEIKICSKCHKELPATMEYFNIDKSVKSGLKAACKECSSKANKINHEKYYLENKEKVNKKNMDNYYKKYPKKVIEDGHRKCSICGKTKLLSEFGKASRLKDGYRGQCIICRKIEYQDNKDLRILQSREWYKNNKDKAMLNHVQWRLNNKELYDTYSKKYYINNSYEIKQRSKNYLYNKMESDIGFKILQRCRSRLYNAIKRHSKAASTKTLIGCSIDDLITYLENQFQDGMTWNNYGKWHIDHIMPCASFDFSKPEEQYKCFNYTNLQPLWADDNYRKHDKILAL